MRACSFVRHLVLACLLAAPSISFGQAPEIPPRLSEWSSWVLGRDPTARCSVTGDSRRCLWPSELRLDVSARGALFVLTLSVEAPLRAQLPGDTEFPPLIEAVQRDGTSVPYSIRFDDGLPHLSLSQPGSYEVRGAFAWEATPKALRLPPGVASVALMMSGKRIDHPRVDASGSVWLEESDPGSVSEVRGDSLSVEVFRNLIDGAPQKLESKLRLRVGGRGREVVLPRALPEGFSTIQITSPLPYKRSGEQGLSVQLRPGEHEILIESLRASPFEKYSVPDDSQWPEREIWFFTPHEAIRTAELVGGTPVEPSSVSAPAEWSQVRAFALKQGESLSVSSSRRGESAELRNSLVLARTFWVSPESGRVTIRDRFSGSMNSGWRLDTDLALGRVTDHGEPVLVTKSNVDGRVGFETRGSAVQLEAVSEGDMQSLDKAVGWSTAVDSLEADLNLPPGWRLFWSSGPEVASGSWTERWTLLRVFTLLLIALAIGKLLGKREGLIAAAVLVLTHAEPFAPYFLWLHLLVALALYRFLPPGRIRIFVGCYLGLSLAIGLLVASWYALNELHRGVFPHVQRGVTVTLGLLEVPYFIVEAGPLYWPFLCLMGASLVWPLRVFMRGSYAKGVALAVVLFMVAVFGIGMISAFTAATHRGVSSVDGYAPPQSVPFASKRSMARESRSLMKGYAREESAVMADLESKESRLLQTVDPNALVQTGPGMPAWNGTRYSLRWSGPVAAQEKLSLYLFGPTTNLFLAVARALLVLLLVWIFAQKVGVRGLIGDISAKLAATIVIACSIFAAGAAEAQEYPSRELLEELNARLTRDECKDHCASISKAVLKVDDAGRDLHMALTGVSSAASAGVPIPGTSADLALRELRLNGVPRAALARDGEGNIWIRVPSGPFSIEVTLRLAAPVSFSVQFPLSPSRIEIDAPGWSVTGLGRGLSATGPVEFVRNEQAGRKEESASEVFPSWLLVRRTFDIAVPWSVTTEVTRMGDLKRAEVVRVPLLAGESPRDASVVTKEESEGLDAVLSFPAGQEQVIFSSEFPARTEVTLRATTRERISEEWIVRCSSVFQCSFSGGARISSVRDGVFSPAYRPFPGEELKLSVSRPEGVPGSTFTVDDVTYSVSQGDTLLAGTVDINVRASRPGEVPVVLPEGSRLKSVVVFGRDETSRFRAPELQVPVGTGTTAIRIAFDLERAVGLVSSVPSIKVGEESFNVTVKWTLPKSRWVLWLGGPAWGPLVMFWVKLLTILALAYLASRIPGTPIGVSGWVLLGVGLIDLPILVAIVPALWFGAFSLRASLGSVASRFFNLGQVGLAMLSLLFLWVLYVTAGRGLSLAPNMLIAYPQGTSGLQWYLDRVAGWIATPWALSLPSWAWHGFMLAWALWVVYSLLTWLPWAYAAWTSGGVWRRGSAAEAKEVDTSK